MQLSNHESFLLCPGKQPIKIGASYAVSIHIYFDDFVRRKNKNRQQQQQILVHIADDDDDYDNQPDNQINAHGKIIKNAPAASSSSSSAGQSTHKNRRFDNKSSEAQIRINLIESNRNIKSINDGKIKHFVRIYHWSEIDKQTTKATHRNSTGQQINKIEAEKHKNKQSKKAPMWISSELK